MTTRPFYRKDRQIVNGFNMASLFDKRVVKGDIGIEIEVEGNKFQKENIPLPWTYHKDNSLRGEDNAEYVLKAPIPFERVPEAIGTLWQMFSDYGSILDESNRTSVHIHLNMQKFHLNRLTSFFALYFSVEELLTEWCGDHRVGNLFCLRAKDATAIVSQTKKFIQYGGRYEFRDGMHYAGLNVGALHKFGSVEIRTLRGVNDPTIILDWIAILERIYNLSADFPDPREIPAKFSSEGPLNYLEMILGDKTMTVRNGIDYSIQKVRDSLYEGIRLAQDLCYCRDWSLYKPSETSPDPFGRAAKMSDPMMQPGGGLSPATVTTTYAQFYAQAITNAAPGAPMDWAIVPPPMPSHQQTDEFTAEFGDPSDDYYEGPDQDEEVEEE